MSLLSDCKDPRSVIVNSDINNTLLTDAQKLRRAVILLAMESNANMEAFEECSAKMPTLREWYNSAEKEIKHD